MVIFGKPSDLKSYICVDSKVGTKLHKLGFQPCYRFFGEIYFARTKEILEVVESEL